MLGLFGKEESSKYEDSMRDKLLLFDESSSVLSLCEGETLISTIDGMKDLRSGNSAGKLQVTSLRYIFISSASARTNCCIGLGCIVSVQVTNERFRIRANRGTSKYEFEYGYENADSLNHAIRAVRAYDKTHLYREVIMRSMNFVDKERQLVLLEKEVILERIDGASNLSNSTGSIGVFIFTTYRVVWHALLLPQYNVSVPLFLINTTSVRQSSFGTCLVINICEKAGSYTLGFQLPGYDENGLNNFATRIRNTPRLYVLGTELFVNVSKLEPPEDVKKYNVTGKKTIPEDKMNTEPESESPEAEEKSSDDAQDVNKLISSQNDLNLTETDLMNAFKKGKKPWGRSKIMIVGEGRAGKTALTNSIVGKSFQDTSSTVGINQFTCDVKYASMRAGIWNEFKKPERELEAALAMMVMDERQQRESAPDMEFAIDIPFSEAKACVDGTDYQFEDYFTNTSGEVEVNGRVDDQNPCLQQLPESVVSDIRAASAERNCLDTPAIKPNITEVKDEEERRSPEPANVPESELVMKCVADSIQTADSKVIMSVFDFGGQSVFNVIHPLFLTKYGVYLLVFNMEWLCNGADEKEKEECTDYMTFWMNSIVVHTQGEGGSVAPIFLVGTRKDKINDVSEHEGISTLLYDMFSSSIAWPFVVENTGALGVNGCTDLFFFPVDNTLGRDDPVLKKLLICVEQVIDDSSYVHAEQPLSWLKALDRMKEKKSSYLNYVEVEKICLSCDIQMSFVPKFLYFLHEMGMVMWHAEEGLRDIVILDPIEYFVTPASVVICKHAPTSVDSTYHSLDVHKRVKKMHNSDWGRMVRSGVISSTLLIALLQDVRQHAAMLVQLMVKYGLLVPLLDSADGHFDDAADSFSAVLNDSSSLSTKKYLAPALLPVDTVPLSDDNWTKAKKLHTFYFVFTASKDLQAQTTLNWDDCRQMGFLPNGLFERLICKAVSWSLETSVGAVEIDLSGLRRDQAILYFGSQCFRLVLMNRENAVRVDVEGESPVAVYERLRSQIEKTIAECMKCLLFMTVLPYIDSDSSTQGTTSNVLLIRLKQVRQSVQKHTALNLLHGGGGGRRLLDFSDITTRYGGWLSQFKAQEKYDIFISYRWGKFDSTFAQGLFDRMSLYSLAPSHRAVSTFLDCQRLREGENFLKNLVHAIINSYVVVPLISSDSLCKMQTHDPTVEDNLLFEWIVVLACITHNSSHASGHRIRIVLPILFGQRNELANTIGDLFQEETVDTLPECIPDATLGLAKRLLADKGIEIPPDVQQLSVKGIVKRLLQHLCILTWSIVVDASLVLAAVSKKVVEVLQQIETDVAKLDDCSSIESTVNEKPNELTSTTALSTPVVGGEPRTRTLTSLTVDEVCSLLRYIDLSMYVSDFEKNRVDGEMMTLCETIDDIKEIGVTKNIHAKKIMRNIEEWKGVDGVPSVALLR